MKELLLFLFLTFTQCWSQKAGCPPKEDIKPCTCLIGTDKKPWVACDGLSSLPQLQKAVKGMVDYRLSSFHLEKSNIGVLPADIFADLEIDSLNIMFTNLTGLSESMNRPPFLGQERSLELLEIRDSFRNEKSPLHGLSLSHLKKLTLLQLEGNLIPTIGNDWFESGPYGLKELYLLDSYTKKLGSHVFTSLQNLVKLSVTGGSVSELTRDMFSLPALHMESLDFSNNKIATLPANIFAKMPSLEEVFFENNDFTSIDQVVFAPIWSQLSHVFFSGNALKCDKEMQWIFKYRLPESLQGNCAEPAELQSRPLSNLTIADFGSN